MSHQPRYLNSKQIKESIDPEGFYLKEQELLRLKNRSGSWAEAGLCPFHPDKTAGSFKVNFNTGAFRCWSCGTSGGDIIDFTMKRDGLNFKDAIRKLADDWRVVC